jgi:hypothetical protein
LNVIDAVKGIFLLFQIIWTTLMHCINGLHNFNANVSSIYHLVRTFLIRRKIRISFFKIKYINAYFKVISIQPEFSALAEPFDWIILNTNYFLFILILINSVLSYRQSCLMCCDLFASAKSKFLKLYCKYFLFYAWFLPVIMR